MPESKEFPLSISADGPGTRRTAFHLLDVDIIN